MNMYQVAELVQRTAEAALAGKKQDAGALAPLAEQIIVQIEAKAPPSIKALMAEVRKVYGIQRLEQPNVSNPAPKVA